MIYTKPIANIMRNEETLKASTPSRNKMKVFTLHFSSVLLEIIARDNQRRQGINTKRSQSTPICR